MLPVYIIEELLRRERHKKASKEVFVEQPELDVPMQRKESPRSKEEPKEERGVAFIDFTI